MPKNSKHSKDKPYSIGRDRVFYILLSVLLLLALFSASLGRYTISVSKVFGILLNLPLLDEIQQWTSIEQRIVLWIRLPRILAAILIGLGLAVSGASAQGLFCNPLVDSGIIGVTSGAAFGGTLAILLFESSLLTLVFAFAFGMLSILAVMLLARINGRMSVLSLVLVGVIVSTFFGSAISIIKLLADPFAKLPSITYWLMGSIASVGYSSLVPLTVSVLPASLLLYSLRNQLNVVSLGEERARALGIPFAKVSWLLLVAMALISAGVVATAGSIGWLGLIVPHIARFWVGANHVRLLPVAALIGAIFMLSIDDIARTATETEIPIGIVTSLVGVPVFAVIMRRAKNERSGWTHA